MKYYKSLREVERDIEISKLRADIEQEKLRLRADELKQTFSRKHLVSNLFRETGKRLSFAAIMSLFNRRRKRRRARGRK